MSKTARKVADRKAPFKFNRIEEIDWIDSVQTTGWGDSKDYGVPEPTRCRSTGYLLCENKRAIQLGMSQDADLDNINAAISIPKVAILKRRRIR